MKLKDSVIIKNVNEGCIYAIDLLSPEDNFIKFEGASSFFLNQVRLGKNFEEILALAKNEFDCDAGQLQADLNDFIDSLKEFELLA